MTSQSVEEYFRFCPACGTANPDVGRIPFRCGQCGYAHFFGPVAAVGGLIVDHRGRLLLVRRATDPGKGKWGLPGGFVDRDETIEQALERETAEETGLHIESAEFLMTYPNDYNYRGIIMSVIDQFFVCRVTQTDRVVLAEQELDHYEWVWPTARHLENMAFHSNRLAVEQWQQQSKFA